MNGAVIMMDDDAVIMMDDDAVIMMDDDAVITMDDPALKLYLWSWSLESAPPESRGPALDPAGFWLCRLKCRGRVYFLPKIKATILAGPPHLGQWIT